MEDGDKRAVSDVYNAPRLAMTLPSTVSNAAEGDRGRIY